MQLCPLLLMMAAGADPVTIGDERMRVSVSPGHGGEASSLQVRHRGQWVETLYLANDYAPRQGWTGKAPWLWPATGKNPPLPAHGFARDMAWQVESKSAKRVVVSLADSTATRKLYPHGFRLHAAYEVAAGKLTIHYKVAASRDNTAAMPFSAGNHITFRTPLLAGSDPLEMTFESPSTVEHMKNDGVPTGESRPRSFSKLARLGEIERLSAVSLSGYADGHVWMILRDPAGLAMRIAHRATSVPPEPVVRFNVWGDPAAGYFSPEPWVGLQNGLNSGKGITRLAPGRSWEWWIEISADSR